jgi:hypothetical protein
VPIYVWYCVWMDIPIILQKPRILTALLYWRNHSRVARKTYLMKRTKQTKSVALVRERTILNELPPLVGEVSNNFADRGCCVVSTTDSYGRILDFPDRSRYFSFQVAPQLYSRGWVDPVPDPLLLRKSGSAGNRTPTSGSVARNSDH